MSNTPTRTLMIERRMSHPPEKIWRALTDGALMREWLLDNNFQPVVGHAFRFRTKPMPDWNGEIDAKVLVVQPHEKLSYTWNALGLTSVVVWTLVAADGGGTLVRMEQSGFHPDQKAEYGGARYGWEKFIGELERVVAGLN